MKDNRQLKNFIITPSRQLRLVVISSVAVTVIYSVAVFTIVRAMIVKIAYSASDYEINALFQQKLNVAIQQAAVQIVLTGAIILFGSIVAMIMFTHRFFGPLVPIKKFIQEIRNGNFAARVSIRDTDELHDIVGDLNEMAKSLEERSTR